jgi:hypothetical protein
MRKMVAALLSRDRWPLKSWRPLMPSGSQK